MNMQSGVSAGGEARPGTVPGRVAAIVLGAAAWLDRRIGFDPAALDGQVLRQAQAARYARSVPGILIANIVFAVTISGVLAWSGDILFPLGWLATTLAISLLGLRQMALLRARIAQRPPSKRFTTRIIRDSVIVAAPWAVLALAYNPGAAPQLDGVIGITVTCLSCVGAFTMAIQPSAALAFLATLWIGRITHLLFLGPELVVTYLVVDAIFLGLAVMLLRSMALLFLERVRADAEIARLNEEERCRASREAQSRDALEARVRDFHGSVTEVLGSLTRSIERMNASAGELDALSNASRARVVGFPDMIDRAKLGLLAVTEEASRMTAAVAAIRGGAENTSGFMHVAAERVRDASSVKERLTAHVNEVDEVTNLIRDIARRTKLVALNATIEAAQAGALGAGFSVVAAEVKHLSGLTNEAAEVIIQRIEDIRGVTEQSLSMTHEIESSAKRVVDAARSIVAASDSQVNALDNIVAALMGAVEASEAVAQAVQVVMAGSQGAFDQGEQVSQTARLVDDTARVLNETVSAFATQIVRRPDA